MSDAGPPPAPELPRAEIEAVVRAYAAKVARRYAPVVAAFAAVALIIALVPSVSHNSGLPVAAGDHLTAAPAGSSAASPGAVAGDAGAGGSAGAPAGLAGVGSSGTPATVAGGSSASVPGADSGVSGIARSGVTCTGSARQVAWSHYAPLCVARFTGNNPGATSHGVTGSTITVTYRISNSGESSAVNAAAQGSFPTQQQFLADLQTYVNYFNSQFELYGRHVVIKPFTGQGDWVQELQDQDLGAAQADAVTAYDAGAFGDISQAIDVSTGPYVQDLAAEHVVSVGGVVASQPFLQRNAPYAYTVVPTIDDLGNFEGNLLCDRMAGLPAAFAGDPLMKNATRVFGVLNPETPDYAISGNMIVSDLQSCGGKVAKHITYALDISTLATQDTSIIAQMKAAGVTTVVCGICDDVSPLFLTEAADSQQYHPEWVTVDDGDQYGEIYSQGQYGHALGPGQKTPAPSTTEAYRVFKLASPQGSPAELSRLSVAYGVALQLFDGLQAAGPDLTPDTFERAEFSLPASVPGGDLGPWQFGTNVFSPQAALPLGWYDPNAPSPITGKNGTWQSCAGADGDFHPWTPASAFGPPRTQPKCFG